MCNAENGRIINKQKGFGLSQFHQNTSIYTKKEICKFTVIYRVILRDTTISFQAKWLNLVKYVM